MKDNQPLVSICCITYNHENYIREAIEGFLLQKTNFPIEIIIHDDSSTDGTAEIVKEYAEKYPELIIPIYQSINQYSQGIKPWPNFVFPRARGKYIALCEGDDYWTDSFKLQKQVDFLEASPEYAICFHPVKIWKKGEIIEDYITKEVPETTTIQDLAEGNYIHTPSVMFRNKLFDKFPEEFYKALIGDYFLHMLNARYGKIKKLKNTMGVYRIHEGGVHSSSGKNTMLQRWCTTMFMMIPAFEGGVKKTLVNNCLSLSKDMLRYSTDLTIEEKIQFQRFLSELAPEYFVTLMKENIEIKSLLNSGRNALEILKKKVKIRLIKMLKG